MKKFLLLFLTFFMTLEIAAAGMCLQKICVTKVCDGDTVKGTVHGKEVSIRLSGIDCYETSQINRAYRQAYENKITIEEVVRRGRKSKSILRNFLKNNQEITVRYTDIDKYGRTVGILYAGNVNINEYMIQQGGCMVYNYHK